MLLERSIAENVERMPSSVTIDTAEHGRPHFRVRLKTIVRITLISLLAGGACADVLGMLYVKHQNVDLDRRADDIAVRFVRPPMQIPSAERD